MKGIVLAAGKGTRLYPMTKPVCKPLLPVYDKPLIYYPIAILMQAGISEILVIVPPNEIADALLIGQEFVGDDRVCLVLGDNIFYAPTLGATLKKAAASPRPPQCSATTWKTPAPLAWWSSTRMERPFPLKRSPATPSPTISCPVSTSMISR